MLNTILTKADYNVIQAFSGSEGQLRLDLEQPDLIILDLMLQGVSGESLIKQIRREKNMNMPIIVISAKIALEIKVETMTAGADDYITKPFESEEILVRVHAALRRYKGDASDNNYGVYSYKGLRLLVESRTVTVGGIEISLTKREYDILQLLITEPQKVYSRERIYELVHVNIRIKRGEVYGLVGDNGAGKSTFLKIISGQVFPASGEIKLFGESLPEKLERQRKRTGAIIESPGFFPQHSIEMNLEYYRIQKGVPGSDTVKEVLNKVLWL